MSLTTQAARTLGSAGGKSKSKAKVKAARKNIAKATAARIAKRAKAKP